jgi:hypothetical protein
VYVAFDILFAHDRSVINRPLAERHTLLQRAVRALPSNQDGIVCSSSSGGGGGGAVLGRIVPLLPDVHTPLRTLDVSMGPESAAAAATEEGLAAATTAAAAAAASEVSAGTSKCSVSSVPRAAAAVTSDLILSRIGRSLDDLQAMMDVALARQVRITGH